VAPLRSVFSTFFLVYFSSHFENLRIRSEEFPKFPSSKFSESATNNPLRRASAFPPLFTLSLSPGRIITRIRPPHPSVCCISRAFFFLEHIQNLVFPVSLFFTFLRSIAFLPAPPLNEIFCVYLPKVDARRGQTPLPPFSIWCFALLLWMQMPLLKSFNYSPPPACVRRRVR